MRSKIVARKFLGSHSIIFVKGKDFNEEFFSHFGEFLLFEYFADGLGLDFLDKLFLGFGSPWGVSSEHFEEYDSYGPEIGFVGVLIFFKGLWGHVQRRANIILTGLGKFFALDSKSKIGDFERFRVSYQKIGRLEVSVDDFV